jgi:probable F420-dependent oxidoreductase
MKVGVIMGFGAWTQPEHIAAAGRAVEERGFHSLWAPEHVVFFEEYASRYPYSDDGRLPAGGTPIEPFLALTWLAASTQRLRLGTGICLVPQRNPVYTAKQVADLDYLSGGRVDFGIGIGWLREEFGALGVPWEQRAERTRDYVGVMHALWTQTVSSYKGEFYSLPACTQSPKPVQKPHPPLHFGGESDAALRRVADLGQGWFGFRLTPEQVPAHLAKLDALLAARGRTRRDAQISIAPPARAVTADSVARYRDLGVDQIICLAGGRGPDEVARQLDALAAIALEPRR